MSGLSERMSGLAGQRNNSIVKGFVDSLSPVKLTTEGSISPKQRRDIRRKLIEKSKIPGHIVWTKWMNSVWKNHTVAVLGEFVGTTMFLFFAFAGTSTANINAAKSAGNVPSGVADLSVLLYISFSFGFSLMVNAWIFYRISGGLFNPAVTLALTLTRDLPPIRAGLLLIAQISGGCFAAFLVDVMFPSPLMVGTTLSEGTSNAQGVWIEAVCTAGLVFTIIMLAKEKHRATFMAPVGIGLSLFISELVSVYYTGGSLNPARSFGPAAVTHEFLPTQWIYWVGPFVGSVIAFAFYRLMKVLEYEMANPGQDGDYENDPTKNPNHEIHAIVQERQAEVEEIAIIQAAGGFAKIRDSDSLDEADVLDRQGVISMAVTGVQQGDEVRVRRVRAGDEPDLEAQWNTDRT